MNSFLYQLHAHTTPCSHCGRMTPAQYALSLYEGGFSGGVVTNHFFGGNTGIDRSLNWNDFVSQYENDWLECEKEAKKYNINIFFGIEEHHGGGREILYYGITPAILHKHPELMYADVTLWSRIMKENGVLRIQAHPFRSRDYNTEAGVYDLSLIDGIEIFNRGNKEEDDRKAVEFALRHPEIIATAGSDAHLKEQSCLCGIKTSVRISTARQLVSVLRNREFEIITCKR